MKKVLVAAASMMLVGTMASSAMAEVEFWGDARARFYYQDDYNNIEDETNWNSRVRINMKYDTKGGAYAITRLDMGSAGWNGADDTNEANTAKAYIGVPFGPVTVEAGRQDRDITSWLLLGNTVDGIDFNYKKDNTLVVAFMDIEQEGNNAVSEDDETNYGAVLVQGFEGGWQLTVGGLYNDNEVADTDGFAGTAKLEGALGAASLVAELAFAEEETAFSNTDDDGWGGYLQASMPVGPANITGILGFTTDGYTWDGGDFGPFEMIGGVNQVNTGINPSAIGETIFAVLNPSFQATENIKLSAVLAYVNTEDMYDGVSDDADFFEISGRVDYTVVDGAKLVGRLGYLDTDDYWDEDPIGAGLSLEVSF